MIRLLALLLISSGAFAAPKEVEVWFLSNAKTALLKELLDRPAYIYSARVAQLECQEMGDYCFDPQYGLYKRNDSGPIDIPTEKIMIQGPVIPAASSVDRELVNCDGTNRFDIFCGKARSASGVAPKLDLWIDTSSSMKEFDYQQKDGSCHRQSLVKDLDKVCGFNQRVNVMMFDTSIKQAGTMDQLCNNQGLNDYKRLMDWIERSDAQKLVIITDIYEFHKEFSDYIEAKHGKLRGDKDPLSGKQLLDLADELAKSCR